MRFIICLTILSFCLLAPLAGQATYVLHRFAGGDFPYGSVATQVSLGDVTGIALDPTGNLYIAASNKEEVYKVTNGKISTFAKTTPALKFQYPLELSAGFAADYQGNLYVPGQDFMLVQKIDSTGKITNFFGQDLHIGSPTLVAPDHSGNLYIADGSFPALFKVNADGSYAVQNFVYSLDALAVDLAGNVYVADAGGAVIRKVDPSGKITIFAGTGQAGTSGDGGPATQAQFKMLQALATDALGNLYIADGGVIRKIDANGIITTVWADGQDFLVFIAVDASGNLYSYSLSSQVVYRKDTTGSVSTVAGNHFAAHSGDGGPAPTAQLRGPRGMFLDVSGNLLFADVEGTVRKVDPHGIITTLVPQVANNALTDQFTPQGPSSVTYDSAGNLVVADDNGHRILSYTPSGTVSTIAGTDYVQGYSGDGGPAIQAKLRFPAYAIFDSSGNLLISDRNNHAIRKVDKKGVITTIAGTGTAGFGGDGGPAIKALLHDPTQIALDAAGNLYVADSFSNRIRKIDKNGIITTIAGSGQIASTGDGGQATSASLDLPLGVAIDASGDLFISQYGAVRHVDTRGIITTIAGGGTLDATEGIPAMDADLGGNLQSLLLGKSGQVYVSGGDRIYTLTPGAAPVPPPQVTVDSSAQNLAFTISGDQCPAGTYTTPMYVTFTGSNTCTIAFNQKYAGPRGGRYVFGAWSDGVATNARPVTAPPGAATGYFAKFQLQFPLTLSVQPAALASSATITAVPTSPDGFYNEYTEVQITAKAPPGYVFKDFSGALTGRQNGQTFYMNSAANIVAHFEPDTPRSPEPHRPRR